MESIKQDKTRTTQQPRQFVPLKGKFANQKVGCLLVLADLTQGHSSRTIPMRSLDTGHLGSSLARGFSGQLFARGLAACGLASRLFGTSHIESTETRKQGKQGNKENKERERVEKVKTESLWFRLCARGAKNFCATGWLCVAKILGLRCVRVRYSCQSCQSCHSSRSKPHPTPLFTLSPNPRIMSETKVRVQKECRIMIPVWLHILFH